MDNSTRLLFGWFGNPKPRNEPSFRLGSGSEVSSTRSRITMNAERRAEIQEREREGERIGEESGTGLAAGGFG